MDDRKSKHIDSEVKLCWNEIVGKILKGKLFNLLKLKKLTATYIASQLSELEV